MSSRQVKKKSAATTKKPSKPTTKKKAIKKVEPSTPKSADAKPAATPDKSKVFDVAKPGESMPSSTTRPIIMTRRPIARDPMVSPQPSAPAEVPAADTEKPAGEELAAYASRPKKNRIEPLNSDLQTDGGKETGTEAAAKPDKTESAFSVPLNEKSSLELVKEADPDEEDKTASPAEETQPQEPAAEQEMPAEPEKPAESEEVEANGPAEAAPSDEPAEDGKPEPDASESEQPDGPEEAGDNTAKKDDDMGEVSELAGQAAAKKAQKSAEEEAAKRLAALEALVEKKTYNVPVNAVHKRHNAHLFVALLLLILVLAGLAAAIDAGLLDVGMDLPFDLLPDDTF